MISINKGTSTNSEGKEEHQLLVEGYGLQACMNTPGIEVSFSFRVSVSFLSLWNKLTQILHIIGL